MKNYVFIYRETTDTSATEDTTAAWGAWFGQLGEKIVDAGNPCGDGQSVTKGGVVDVKSSPVTGYTIVKAGSMDEAVELAKTCPLVQSSETAVVEVYEALPM